MPSDRAGIIYNKQGASLPSTGVATADGPSQDQLRQFLRSGMTIDEVADQCGIEPGQVRKLAANFACLDCGHYVRRGALRCLDCSRVHEREMGVEQRKAHDRLAEERERARRLLKTLGTEKVAKRMGWSPEKLQKVCANGFCVACDQPCSPGLLCADCRRDRLRGRGRSSEAELLEARLREEREDAPEGVQGEQEQPHAPGMHIFTTTYGGEATCPCGERRDHSGYAIWAGMTAEQRARIGR